MKKSIKVHPKKRRGRPATGKDPLVSARLPQSVIDQVEEWAATNGASRSEAIRRLVELGLTVKTKAAPSEQLRAARSDRAKELAAKTIEKIIDPTAPPEERIERKRRLTKGPTEFRDARVDQPKAKGK
jgi:Arc/MetJ-type ribon-helix-helix transcriptional regulator